MFMDEDGEKLAPSKKRSGEVDWISNLPDCLIFEILLNLPTKDVVKTSTLSSRWKDLWKYVPGLDLETDDFREHDSFVRFVDSFLDFNRDSYLQSFKLRYESSEADEPETGNVRRWLDTVARLKVEHLDVSDYSSESWDIEMYPTLYTCGSLVSLELCGLTLPSPELVYLPSLRDMGLILVEFTDELALETLISRCPVLENLSIRRSYGDNTPILRVRSHSLLRFIHIAQSYMDFNGDDRIVEIDAPMLEYLKIHDRRTASVELKNPVSLVQADIDLMFNLTLNTRLHPNDLPKRNMIHNFLVGISRVKDMIIDSSTLKVIYDYSRYVQIPSFRNLSSLRVKFDGYRWEMLSVFLESCPNLKSLVVGSTVNYEEGITIFPRRPRVLSSLEYVKIERPLKGEALEMKLVGYLLENSQILKKLTLCLDDSLKKEESAILKELLMIPRISKYCQVVML